MPQARKPTLGHNARSPREARSACLVCTCRFATNRQRRNDNGFIQDSCSGRAAVRDRSDVGGQIADLSRGTADLARQVAEFGRRLAAVEGRLVSANSTGADRIQAVSGEIGELGVLVKQLAASVANHDDMLPAGISSAGVPAAAPARWQAALRASVPAAALSPARQL